MFELNFRGHSFMAWWEGTGTAAKNLQGTRFTRIFFIPFIKNRFLSIVGEHVYCVELKHYIIIIYRLQSSSGTYYVQSNPYDAKLSEYMVRDPSVSSLAVTSLDTACFSC